MEAGEATIRASRCIFVQAFRALHHKDPKLLRSCWDGDRVFQVGLGVGIDDGLRVVWDVWWRRRRACMGGAMGWTVEKVVCL